MIGLAGACAAIGLLPVFALPPVLRAGARIAGAPPGVALPVPTQSLTWFALALAAALAGAWLLRSWRGRGVPVARADTWGCGYDGVTARMQYTASSFAQPLLAAFRPVAGIETMRTPTTLSTHAVDPVLGGVLRPAWRAVRRAAGGLRPIQRGRISAYLAYLAAALVTLLLYLLLAGGGP
jgi:hydrogenase-4 component B